MAKSPEIKLSTSERNKLESWLRATKTEQRLVLRAKIILMAAEDRTNIETANELKTSVITVGKWRTRFAKHRANGLSAKATDIVALNLNLPQNAIVFCVDEKPSIQALERSQGWLKLPDGKAITGYSHEYKRHGTINLFAALDIATGLVKTGNYKRKRREEFLDFMNNVIDEYLSDTEIHVVLDNYSTHKVQNDKWVTKHKNVTFHYTPTHASWLNPVEVWFSILWRKALKGVSFTSPTQVCETIERFVKVYSYIRSGLRIYIPC